MFIISNADDFGAVCFEVDLDTRKDLRGLVAQTDINRLLTITTGATVVDNIGNTGVPSTTLLYAAGTATVVGSIQSFGRKVQFTFNYQAAQVDESPIVVQFFAGGRNEPIIYNIGATYLNNPCEPKTLNYESPCTHFGGRVCPVNICGGDSAILRLNGATIATITEEGAIVTTRDSLFQITFEPDFANNVTFTAITVDGVTRTISVAGSGANAGARAAAAAAGLNALDFVGGGFQVDDTDNLQYNGPLNIEALTSAGGDATRTVDSQSRISLIGGLGIYPRDCNCGENEQFLAVYAPTGITCTDVLEYVANGVAIQLNPLPAANAYAWDLDNLDYTAADVVVITGVLINGVNLLGSAQTLAGTTLDAVGQEIANLIASTGSATVVYNTTTNVLTTGATKNVFGSITGTVAGTAFTLAPTVS